MQEGESQSINARCTYYLAGTNYESRSYVNVFRITIRTTKENQKKTICKCTYYLAGTNYESRSYVNVFRITIRTTKENQKKTICKCSSWLVEKRYINA